MRLFGGWTVCLAVWLVGLTGVGTATDYYVAPTGSSDSNDGSIGSPFATFGKAIGLATAGDTIFARGGTYNLSSKLQITKAGATNNPIKLWAYPGETPILDFSAQSDSDSNRGVELSSSADWWHMKGLTIQHAGDNGFNTSADHGVFEQFVTRNNRDSGFQLSGSASFNRVLNSDSYENYDPPKRGEDADGFAVKTDTIGPGNIFMGNRAWRNSDDGWDMFESRANGVLIVDSWAYDNGYDPGGAGAFNGDGNAFKLGRDSGSHILANVLAFSNPHNGIDVNGNGYIHVGGVPTVPNGSLVQVYNSTSYNNGLSSGTNFRFDEDLPHILRNNISVGAGVVMDPAIVQQLNTWNGIFADEDDFLSTSDAIARGPRNLDGSLPLSDFLRLASDSNLIDVGTPISLTFGGVTYNLPYNGMAPDLGAFETVVPVPELPGDYNGDHVVNAADYTVWRNNLNTNANLPNDETPGFVDAGDYGVWKSHFGESSLGSGSLAQSAVPEPGTASLILAAAILLGVCRRKSSIGRVAMHGRG
jgi:hypothetical protein